MNQYINYLGLGQTTNFFIKDNLNFRNCFGNFHFKMVWPGIGGFNEWLQSSNPVTKSTVTGFKGKTHSGLCVIDQPCKKHNTNIFKKNHLKLEKGLFFS